MLYIVSTNPTILKSSTNPTILQSSLVKRAILQLWCFFNSGIAARNVVVFECGWGIHTQKSLLFDVQRIYIDDTVVFLPHATVQNVITEATVCPGFWLDSTSSLGAYNGFLAFLWRRNFGGESGILRSDRRSKKIWPKSMFVWYRFQYECRAKIGLHPGVAVHEPFQNVIIFSRNRELCPYFCDGTWLSWG